MAVVVVRARTVLMAQLQVQRVRQVAPAVAVAWAVPADVVALVVRPPKVRSVSLAMVAMAVMAAPPLQAATAVMAQLVVDRPQMAVTAATAVMPAALVRVA